MKYLEKFNENELKEYEVIEDWSAFIKPYISNGNKDFEGAISNEIYIERKIFNIDTDLSFQGRYKKDFTFNKCHFKKGISLGNSKFHQKFSIINCVLEGAIWSEASPTFHAGLFIINSNIDTVLISKGEYGSCSWSINGGRKLSITGGTFTSLNITLEGKIDLVTIEASKIDGDVFIDGNSNEVETINLSGTARKLSLFINNLQLKFLGITLFVNENRLKLTNIRSLRGEGRVLISNSHLGKAELSSIDFGKYQLVVFDESNLVDCSFNNIVWSKKVDGASPISSNEKISESQNLFSLKSRETFRQLKYAMSKQGDIVNEQKFHSLEMGMYFKTLSWGKDFWTKLIIFLSWLTSDFGQSFWRPLLFIFVFHTILFLPLLLSGFFPEFRFSSYEFSWVAFGKGFNSYFFLMNPFRKVDENMFKGAWIIIDIFMRISASYMIYNMIRATRRFIK